MRSLLIFVFFIILSGGSVLTPTAAAQSPTDFEVEWPARRLWVGAKDVENIRIRALGPDARRLRGFSGSVQLTGVSTTAATLHLTAGEATLPKVSLLAPQVTVRHGSVSRTVAVPNLNGFLSLIPALVAIGLAIWTRQVLVSLLGGVILGAGLCHRTWLGAAPRALDTIVREVSEPDHARTLIFTLMMGGLVGLISASGGTRGIVALISGWARTVRTGSLATWGLGMLIFFDDYASSLIIGTTMRPLTDRLRISREKLSYIVDSTAAPISSLALISTWIGYEVSVLDEALQASQIPREAYEVFLMGLPSRFYQIFALVFVVIVAVLGRDFGPMLTAERRARREGKVLRDGAEPLLDAGLVEDSAAIEKTVPRAWLAFVPLAVLIVTVLGVLVTSGLSAAEAKPEAYRIAVEAGIVRWMGFILSNAASYDALVYGAAASSAVAMVLAWLAGALDLRSGIQAFVRGLQAMLLALVILALAWSVGQVMEDLHSGTYVVGLVGEALPGWSIGSLAFVLAALIAFATGTSWGTMAVLFPIVVAVAKVHIDTPEFETILLGSTSAVLAGAVFGDHCSPISDTTVLSSIASASDLIDHTRTQAPYAVLCATVAIVFGCLPFGFGVPAPVLLVLGIVTLTLFMRFVGRKPEDPSSDSGVT